MLKRISILVAVCLSAMDASHGQAGGRPVQAGADGVVIQPADFWTKNAEAAKSGLNIGADDVSGLGDLAELDTVGDAEVTDVDWGKITDPPDFARRDAANTFSESQTLEDGADVSGTTVLRAVTDQTDPITEWRDEDDNVVAELGPDGTLLVKAFATSDPSTFVFDQPVVSDDSTTLALPTSGNQILWDSDSGGGDVTIEAVSGGAAGAVYFVVNADSTHSLVFDDSDPDVTVRGGADLTVGPGESCTVIQVTSTTISVH